GGNQVCFSGRRGAKAGSDGCLPGRGGPGSGGRYRLYGAGPGGRTEPGKRIYHKLEGNRGEGRNISHKNPPVRRDIHPALLGMVWKSPGGSQRGNADGEESLWRMGGRKIPAPGRLLCDR